MIFDKKQRQVESLIEQYLDHVSGCVQEFVACVEASLTGTSRKALEEKVRSAHAFESKADDVRREIGVLLYGKALFPESRGDILGLLEAIDKIPGVAQSVVRRLRNHQFTIPPELGAAILNLSRTVQRCSQELIKAVASLFTDYNSAVMLADRVGEIESLADKLEFNLIDEVFDSRRETAEKILLRDIIESIGSIADRAENAADRVRIAAVKRKV